MNNDGLTETRYVESLGEGDMLEASMATGDRPESVATKARANWAWANAGLGYDWMDSHNLFADAS